MTQYNLGTAYRDLPTGDREANLKRAITCYQAALEGYTCEAFPVEWALTQIMLGAVYSDLPAGDRAANLQQAITCYQVALQTFSLRGMDDYAKEVSRDLEAAQEELQQLEEGGPVSR